jgi:colicin import membrane protein
MKSHEDSVLTSIRELQRLEDERSHEVSRRAAQVERDRATARQAEFEREARTAADRLAALEAERKADADRRIREEAVARRMREEAELRVRADTERAHASRLLQMKVAHAEALAVIDAEARAQQGARQSLVIAAFALVAFVAAGYGAVRYTQRETQRATEAAMAADALRRQAAYDLARAQQARDDARRAVPAAVPTVASLQPPASPQGNRAIPRRSMRQTRPAAAAPQHDAPIEIDVDGPDPFALDDHARVRSTRGSRGH